MEKLKNFPPGRQLVGLTLLATIPTLAIFIALRTYENIMMSYGYGIVDYELAFTPGRAVSIIYAWGLAGQVAAHRSLIIDYAFLAAYGAFFAGITLLIARSRSGLLHRVGLWLTVGALLAALLDALENTLLLIQLGIEPNIPAVVPMLAGIFASVKFGLLLLALAYWLIGGAAALLDRTRS